MRWDCERNIKDRLKDPNSYDPIKVSYYTSASDAQVRIDFTSKNSFGGRVRNMAYCTANSSGTIFQVRII